MGKRNNAQNLPQTSNAVENTDQDFTALPTIFCFNNCASFPRKKNKDVIVLVFPCKKLDDEDMTILGFIIVA